MSIETMASAIEAAIEAIVEQGSDLKTAEGAIS